MCTVCRDAPTCECEWRVCAARRGQSCSLCGHDSSAPRRPPASTLVQVAGLAIPGALMEIEAVAVID